MLEVLSPEVLSRLIQRFWNHIDLANDPSCWLWTGSVLGKGYGQLEVRFDGKNGRRHVFLAHRISYELHHGQIPSGLFVCHHCDNPICVNPTHLFLGANADNIHDAMAKGRVPHLTSPAKPWSSRKRPPEEIMRGERNGFAKLTAGQVTEIRLRYAQGGVTQNQLGSDYGVTSHAIWRVIHGINWGHIPGGGTPDPAITKANHLAGIKASYDYERLANAARKATEIRRKRNEIDEAPQERLRIVGLVK